MAQAAGESEPRPFLTVSRAALWGWVAGVFAISAGMFVLGVMVGRGTAPIEFDIDRLKRAVEAAVARANAKLSSLERIRRAGILTEPFTVENGLMTPTMKLRRTRIVERHVVALERLYGAAG